MSGTTYPTAQLALATAGPQEEKKTMPKKVVVVVGGGNPPRLVDLSTPLPPVVPVRGAMPPVGKPFIEMLEEMFRDLPGPRDSEEP